MKFKFQQNTVALNNNAPQKTDSVTFVFTFNTVFLSVAKKLLAGHNKLSKFDDLTIPGSFAKLDNSTIIAITLGSREEFNFTNYLKALKSIAAILKNNKKITDINLVLEESLAKPLNKSIYEYVEASIFHLLNHLYYLDELKSTKTLLMVKNINFISGNGQAKAIDTAIALAQGVFLVKDLANYPANIATPSY